MFIKTQPTITYPKFVELVMSLQSFTSLRGRLYKEVSIESSIVKFIRDSTGKEWKMDLKVVHQAYLELSNFKTANFKSYVPHTHSPALGLLLSIGLLEQQKI